jgi:glutaredoxin
MSHEVIVYSRRGCHLCDDVKAALRKLESQADFAWREVDIDSDPALRAQFNEEVPVIFVNGRKAFKYHLKEDEFLRVLKARDTRSQ